MGFFSLTILAQQTHTNDMDLDKNSWGLNVDIQMVKFSVILSNRWPQVTQQNSPPRALAAPDGRCRSTLSARTMLLWLVRIFLSQTEINASFRRNVVDVTEARGCEVWEETIKLKVLSLVSTGCGLLSSKTVLTLILLTYVMLPTEVKSNSNAIPFSELPSTSCLLCFWQRLGMRAVQDRSFHHQDLNWK